MTNSVGKTPRFYHETSARRSQRFEEVTLPQANPKHRLLLIGTGKIGREHLRVATLLGRAKIVAIYDKHTESMDIAEAEYRQYSSEPLERYSDLAAACKAGDIDALLICTPNYTHYAVLQIAMKSGKPLFLEKPMATSLRDAAKIVELSKSYSGFIQLGMQYRYKAQYTDAFHEVFERRSLGEIKTISVSEYRPPFLDKVEQWNKFNVYSGGTLVEKCCHYFDLINMMAGSEPESVYASGGQAINFLDFEYRGKKSDIDDHAYVIINYKNGIRANFTLNMFSQELSEEMIVSGSKGRLLATEVSSFKPGTSSRANLRVEIDGHEAWQSKDVTYPELIERSGHQGATFFEHEALADQLENISTDSATPIQGLWAMVVASAAQESMATNSLILFDEFIERNNLQEVLQS